MPKIGEEVMYGSIGLCRIAMIMSDGVYILEPVYSKTGQLTASFEEGGVVRELLPREKIDEAFSEVKKAEWVWFPNPDMRSLEYKQAIKNGSFSEWLRLSWSIRNAKQKNRRDTLSVEAQDSRFQKVFERLLAEEYSAVNGIDLAEAKKEIRSRMKKTKSTEKEKKEKSKVKE